MGFCDYGNGALSLCQRISCPGPIMGFCDYGNGALSFIMSENFVSGSNYGLL